LEAKGLAHATIVATPAARRNVKSGEHMEPLLATPAELAAVLDELRALEPLFHTGHDAERIAAPTFWEVGASGNRYSRDYVLAVLRDRAAEPAPADWHAQDFHVAPAGTDHYLLTYTLHQAERVTRRLTVWRRTGGQWQAIYHQGTVVA
jgi:hypothetical protein